MGETGERVCGRRARWEEQLWWEEGKRGGAIPPSGASELQNFKNLVNIGRKKWLKNWVLLMGHEGSGLGVAIPPSRAFRVTNLGNISL